MKKPTHKMSAQNEANLNARVVWAFSPVQRVKPSKKVYNRQKFKRGE